MPVNGLGIALKTLRERRTLSQRELGQLSEVDNAYIYRLETGDKVNPTPETLGKLLRVYRASDRDASILRWLADNPNTWPELVQYTLDTPAVEYEHFVTAATMSFRGDGRPTPEALLSKVKKMYDEED